MKAGRIHADAAGGGSIATQLGLSNGARVIATAASTGAAYLQDLGPSGRSSDKLVLEVVG